MGSARTWSLIIVHCFQKRRWSTRSSRHRDEICHNRYNWRWCEIFASGVNFSKNTWIKKLSSSCELSWFLWNYMPCHQCNHVTFEYSQFLLGNISLRQHVSYFAANLKLLWYTLHFLCKFLPTNCGGVNFLANLLSATTAYIWLIVRCSRKSSLFCQQKSDAL